MIPSILSSKPVITQQINNLIDTSTEGYWKNFTFTKEDQDNRINDIMLKIWSPARKSWLDKMFWGIANTWDQFNEKWNRLDDKMVSTWNQGCDLLRLSKIKIHHISLSELSTLTDQSEAISNVRDTLRPSWDFMGWVTNARVKKIDKILTEYTAHKRLAQLKLLQETIDDFPKEKMTPREIVEQLRKPPSTILKTIQRILPHNLISRTLQGPQQQTLDVRYFSDEELYLIIHLIRQGNFSETLHTTQKNHPVAIWESWKEEGLKKLFASENIPFKLYSDLRSLNPKEREDLIKAFEVKQPILAARAKLQSLQTNPKSHPNILDNSFLIATMRLETKQLWNCLPGDLRHHFERVAQSKIYKDSIDQCLTKEISDELVNVIGEYNIDKQLIENKTGQRTSILEKPDYLIETVQLLLKIVLEDKFGISSYEIRKAPEQADSKFSFSFQDIENKKHSFTVSINLKDLSKIRVKIRRDEGNDSFFSKSDHKKLISQITTKWAQLNETSREKVLQEFLSQLQEKAVKERAQSNYKTALMLFNEVAIHSSADKFQLSEENPFHGLRPDLLKLALDTFTKESIQDMVFHMTAILFYVKNSKETKISPQELEIFIQECQNILTFLKILQTLKQESDAAEDRVLKIKQSYEQLKSISADILKTIPLQKPETKEDIGLFTTTLTGIKKKIKHLYASLQKLPLSHLEMTNPELIKVVEIVQAKLQEIEAQMQPHQYVLNKLLWDHILHIETKLEKSLQDIKTRFPLEAVNANNYQQLAESFWRVKVYSDMLNSMTLHATKTLEETDPGFLQALKLSKIGLEKKESEILAYKLVLNKFIQEKDQEILEEAKEIAQKYKLSKIPFYFKFLSPEKQKIIKEEVAQLEASHQGTMDKLGSALFVLEDTPSDLPKMLLEQMVYLENMGPQINI